VACGLGFTPDQCAEDHWGRALEGGKIGQHYRFRCPVCGKQGCLEVTVKASGIVYRCWYDPSRGEGKKRRPGCPTEAIRAELADLLPCWKGRKSARVRIPALPIGLVGSADFRTEAQVGALRKPV
jgi:hypothetical protein